MDIKTIESRRIYTGKVFKLRQDQVRMPEGQIAELDIIEHHGAVVIVPPISPSNRRCFIGDACRYVGAG